MINLNTEKVLGAMYGLGIGDALGTPFKSMSADEIKKEHNEVREMNGYIKFKKMENPDYTHITFEVGCAIIDFPADPVFSVGLSMIRLQRINQGSFNTYKDIISNVTKFDAPQLEDWFKVSEQYHVDTGGHSDNTALRRIIYPAIFYNQERCVDIAINLGKMTHWHDDSTLAIKCYTEAIAEFVRTPNEVEISYLKERLEFHMQDIRLLEINDLQPTSNVIDTLLCAINCIRDTQSFEDAVVKAVNLGGDTDSIGAITGSLAGAIYGYNEIPQRWLECLDIGVKGWLSYLSDKAIDMNNKKKRTLNSIKKPRKTKVTKSREIVERMFKLYLVLINCEVASYREIFSKVYYPTFKMFQRDFKKLNDVGLINMDFDKKSKDSKGYIHIDGWNSIIEDEYEILTDDCVLERFKFNFENYERIQNPPKEIEQLYRLVDLNIYSLYENFFYCFEDKYYTEYEYCSQDMRNDYISNKVQIKIESFVETKYYNKFPETTRVDFIEDMETLMRLGSGFADVTSKITVGEICQDYIDAFELLCMLEYDNREPTDIEFFWENGEPIDLKKDSKLYFYNFETGANQLGKPYNLPKDTIPKEDWPEVKGYNWDEY